MNLHNLLGLIVENPILCGGVAAVTTVVGGILLVKTVRRFRRPRPQPRGRFGALYSNKRS